MGKIKFNGGLVTARDKAFLRDGELSNAIGIYYRPGDMEGAWKIKGRTAFGTVSAGQNIKGLRLCQFDTGGNDKLLAYFGTVISAATPGLTGSFSSLITGLNASATRLGASHAYNKWYLCNGYDLNRVLKSDGTVRQHGMFAPIQTPVATPSLETNYTARPTANAVVSNGGLVNPMLAYDTPILNQKIISTYASKRATAVSGPFTHSFSTWASSTASNRRLIVTWSVYGAFAGHTGVFDSGTDEGWGGTTTVLIEYSTNGGGAWNTLENRTNIRRNTGVIQSSLVVTANSDQIQVRASFTYGSQSGIPITFYLYDIRITNSVATAFSTTTGMYYAVTEYDSLENDESTAGPVSDLVTLSNQNAVTLDLSLFTAQNTRSTHWRIYRTTDGGSAPAGLGLLATIPIAQTTFLDDFGLYDKDTQPEPLYAMLTITDAEGTGVQRFPRDGAPPTFTHLTFWRGSLVGTSRISPREVFYSFAGRPESWPAIYRFDAFPMSDHDEVVACAPCGESMLIAGREIMMVVDDLPRVSDGVRRSIDIRPLKGLPGAVNQDAIISYNLMGEPRVAWVAPYGLYDTNGTASRRISDNILWKETVGLGDSFRSSAILHWDPELMCLILSFDSDGDGLNDKWAMIHMHPDHADPNGNPKWTGFHYGRFSSQTSGIVSGVYRRYSGHPSDGIVYVEFNGTSDASQSYSSTLVLHHIVSGRLYGPGREWGVYKARLYHGEWGGGLQCEITWNTFRDATNGSQSKTNQVDINIQRYNEFFVGRAGQSHQVTISQTAAPTGAGAYLSELEFDVIPGSEPGFTAV